MTTFRMRQRRFEPLFATSPWVAEFWNTVSNAPFVIIGLLRLAYGTRIPLMYAMYTCTGVASAIHHATVPAWTVVIDWVPISASILLAFHTKVWVYTSLVSCVKCILAFSILATDHLRRELIPPPWGHVMWHIVAALAVDSVYQDAENAQRVLSFYS